MPRPPPFQQGAASGKSLCCSGRAPSSRKDAGLPRVPVPALPERVAGGGKRMQTIGSLQSMLPNPNCGLVEVRRPASEQPH